MTKASKPPKADAMNATTPPAIKFSPVEAIKSLVDRINPKTDLPYRWDYWMYDEHGEYIYKYDYDMSDHPDAEFLEKTDCDADFWAAKFFWNADQATALSFGRSPDEAEFDTYMEEMDGSSEFPTYFCALRERIVEAQQTKILPDLIPARMFIQWAEGNELPFPPSLAGRIDEIFDKMMAIGQQQQEVGAGLVNDTANETLRKGGIEKVSARKEENVLKIIYALAWKHHRLGERLVTPVAQSIEDVLIELSEHIPDARTGTGHQTIADRLKEAIGILGPPPPKK
jgi:hypothetical protein